MSPILKILTVGGVSRPAAAVLRGSGRDGGHGHGDDDGGDVGIPHICHFFYTGKIFGE